MMTKVINMVGVTHLTTFQKILRGLAMTIHYNLYIYEYQIFILPKISCVEEFILKKTNENVDI
jgi:hypothetical protein